MVFELIQIFSSGGTINGSIWRVVGTLIGSFMGWGAIAADGGPYIIVFFGFLLCEFVQWISPYGCER
jgi:hypothetical protein